MEAIKEIKLGSQILRIFNDDSSDSPRNWDNLGKMICFHKRYNLGDKHEYRSDDYDSYAEMGKDIMKKENGAIILPLFMYDHSGITISTTPFGDRWDSGQIGFIVVSKETLCKNFEVKRINKKLLERAEQMLLGEVETYDQFVRGDVYRFEVVSVKKCSEGCEHETHEDSCGGFFGDDFKTNGITDYLSEELAEALKAA